MGKTVGESEGSGTVSRKGATGEKPTVGSGCRVEDGRMRGETALE